MKSVRNLTTIFNMLGFMEISSQYWFVSITAIDVIPHSKPAMVYRTTNAVGEIRRTIELECVFSGK